MKLTDEQKSLMKILAYAREISDEFNYGKWHDREFHDLIREMEGMLISLSVDLKEGLEKE